ncbi:MAG: transposase family protein [Coriobacteriaceae bacterium]|nr:transposase family protein [Coriobacteriaceae bacterium]
MIQDKMINEIQELKLSGYTLKETCDVLRSRRTKVPTQKTISKYYSMDTTPDDNHVKVKKPMAFDVEPFSSAIAEIVSLNPKCCMSSVYDVLLANYVDTGEFNALPGNEQTLRNYIHHLRDIGKIVERPESRRTYDVMDVPPPGEKAQIDFGQLKCDDGLTVHFICIVLWHSRLLGVYAQDHKFNSEESCRAIHRFSSKCGGRVKTLVIDQDSVFVSEEIYGEVFETTMFKSFLEEQEMGIWVCTKADPESKGCVENAVKYVKSNFFSARRFSCIDDVLRALPAWTDRANSRIHQGTYQVPKEVFERVEKTSLRPLLPSVFEAAPLFLTNAPVNSQPYMLYKSVKYSVPWDMCYAQVCYRVIGDKLHIYDDKRRYVCTHDVCQVKGSFKRLEEHRREKASDWLDTAERMREKWNCVDFQHFINGFKKENPDRHLGKQLAAVERLLNERNPSRHLVAQVMSACCRDLRYKYTQFKAVFELYGEHVGGVADSGMNAVDVDVRGMDLYQKAFDERCAS